MFVCIYSVFSYHSEFNSSRSNYFGFKLFHCMQSMLSELTSRHIVLYKTMFDLPFCKTKLLTMSRNRV